MQAAAHDLRGPLSFLPDFRWEQLSGNSRRPATDVLSGTLRPFGRHAPEVILKLAESTADFYLDRQGAIRLADPRQLAQVRSVCRAEEVAGLRTREFTIELWLPRDGSPPKFYAVAPKIDVLTHPNHPHMYLHRELTRAGVFSNELCVYHKQFGLWNPQTRNVYTLLCVCGLWLAKHAYWEQKGRWLGPAASHEPHVMAAIRLLSSGQTPQVPVLTRRVS